MAGVNKTKFVCMVLILAAIVTVATSDSIIQTVAIYVGILSVIIYGRAGRKRNVGKNNFRWTDRS